MKKALLLIVALVFSGTIFAGAQSLFQFGVKGGLLISSTNLKYAVSGNSAGDYDKSSTKAGFEVGFQARVNLPLGFLIQPELVFSRTSGTFPVSVNGRMDEMKVRSNWFEVPVLVGWKFSVLRIMAGPSFRFPIDDNMAVKDVNATFAPKLESFVMGYQVGLGIDLGRVTLDARFCGNFTKVSDEGVMGSGNYNPNLDVTDRKVAIMLGYMILK